MHTPHHPRTLLSVALLTLSAGAHAEDETMTVVGKRSQHEEVATATRTNTPAKLVPRIHRQRQGQRADRLRPAHPERGADRHPRRQRQR